MVTHYLCWCIYVWQTTFGWRNLACIYHKWLSYFANGAFFDVTLTIVSFRYFQFGLIFMMNSLMTSNLRINSKRNWTEILEIKLWEKIYRKLCGVMYFAARNNHGNIFPLESCTSLMCALKFALILPHVLHIVFLLSGFVVDGIAISMTSESELDFNFWNLENFVKRHFIEFTSVDEHWLNFLYFEEANVLFVCRVFCLESDLI